MTESFDATDWNAEMLVSTAAFGVLYDASWSRRWWQFWKRPPRPVVLHFNPPVSDPSIKVTLSKEGVFIIHLDE